MIPRSLAPRTLALGLAATVALTACGTTQQAADSAAEQGSADARPSEPMASTPAPAALAPEDDPFTKLQEAAAHVGAGGSAKALAAGIAKATGMDGDVSSPAATTYATLANLLQEHVYLAGIAISTGVSAGLDTPAFEAAASTLDSNSVALADLIGSVAPDKRDPFLKLWRKHIGFFVDYTKAVAGGDDQARQTALDGLSAYRSSAGMFFEELSGGAIPADAVEQSLAGHVDTLTAAIDAVVAAQS